MNLDTAERQNFTATVNYAIDAQTEFSDVLPGFDCADLNIAKQIDRSTCAIKYRVVCAIDDRRSFVDLDDRQTQDVVENVGSAAQQEAVRASLADFVITETAVRARLSITGLPNIDVRSNTAPLLISTLEIVIE